MDKEYNFIWELTTLCNYKCTYCYRRDSGNGIPWANLETSFKICDFFNKLSEYITGDNKIRITLFGGEPTLVPYLKDIVKYLYDFNNNKLRYSIYTNLSADLDIYRYILQYNCNISSTYHMHHTTLKEYKEKLEILLTEYPKRSILASYVVGKDRISENKIRQEFYEFKQKYDNFELLLIPLLDNNGLYVIEDEKEIIQEGTTKIQDQINHRRNKKYALSDCHNYIMYNGKMARCNQLLNNVILDTTKENAIKTYLGFSKIRMRCDVPCCCYQYEG